MRGRRPDTTAICLLTLLAAAVRLPTLATQSFWLDEGYTVRLVRMSLGGMLSTIPRTESTPPLYYVVAWAWTRVFGSSEFGLRSLSAAAGIATVPVAFAAARRLAGLRAAVACGLLLSVSPLMVWFSQEARAYALATLLATGTVLCLIGWLTERRPVWLAGWATCATLGLLTHYFVVFVVLPELVVLWWRARARSDRRPLLASVPVLIAGLAVVPLAIAQRGTGHADYIAQGGLGSRILELPKQLLVGYASPAERATALAAAALVLLGMVWPLLANAAARRRAALPLFVGLTCVIVPIGLALIGIDFLNTRNLLPALPPLWIGGAIGWAAGRPRRLHDLLLAALAAVFLTIVILVDVNPAYQRDNWRGVADALGRPTVPRAIVVSPGSGLTPLQAYMPRLSLLSRTTPVREIDVVAIPQQVPGAGIGTPPSPEPLPVPPGFRLVRTVASRTYTVVIYRSPVRTLENAPSLALEHLGTSGWSVLLQTPR